MSNAESISGVDLDQLTDTFLSKTLGNVSHAYRFGRVPDNETGICIPQPPANAGGIFLYNNPLRVPSSLYFFQLAYASLLTSACNFMLRPFGQVSIVGQLMGGIIGGPSFIGRNRAFREMVFPDWVIQSLETLASFGIMFLLFLLGVKTDYGMVGSSGSRALLIGVSIFLFPMMFTVLVSLFLKSYVEMDKELERSVQFLPILLSSTTCHGVSRFLTDLNLLNSELGRLALSSSVVSGCLSFATLIFAFTAKQTQLREDGFGIWLCLITSGLAQFIFTKFAIKPIMIWMIKQTPEGQPVKEFYHCLIFLLVLLSAFVSEVMGMHSFFGPLLLGLEVPDASPLAFTVVNKLDCFVSFVMMPVYFMVNGRRTVLPQITLRTFLIVELMSLLGCLSKFIGTILPCVFLCGMFLRDAITLSLIFNGIGILEIHFYTRANQLKFINNQCFSVLNTSALFMTGIVSHLVSKLYDPSVRYTAYTRRTIQHASRKLELRLLVCIHQEEQVPNIINLLEVSNPTRESPISVCLLHLIELVGRASPLLVSHHSLKHFENRRIPIINAFRMFERNNLSIVTLQPFTAIAPYATMHDDICTLALDRRASLLILPFHKQWNADDVKDLPKIRHVNIRVLDKAPCSVGILVDRGAWRGTKSVLGSWSLFRVGVFFTGGTDDREAVAYAMRMAEHPNAAVTLVRFIPFEKDIEHDVIQRRMDNDMIAEFTLSKVRSGKAEYKEEIVGDGVGLCSAIRSMKHSFDLILVGRRSEADSALSLGLIEWTEYPEMGLMGDILASEDVAGKVSVLVIQQHSCAGDDENSSHNETSQLCSHSFPRSYQPSNSGKGY